MPNKILTKLVASQKSNICTNRALKQVPNIANWLNSRPDTIMWDQTRQHHVDDQTPSCEHNQRIEQSRQDSHHVNMWTRWTYKTRTKRTNANFSWTASRHVPPINQSTILDQTYKYQWISTLLDIKSYHAKNISKKKLFLDLFHLSNKILTLPNTWLLFNRFKLHHAVEQNMHFSPFFPTDRDTRINCCICVQFFSKNFLSTGFTCKQISNACTLSFMAFVPITAKLF